MPQSYSEYDPVCGYSSDEESADGGVPLSSEDEESFSTHCDKKTKKAVLDESKHRDLNEIRDFSKDLLQTCDGDTARSSSKFKSVSDYFDDSFDDLFEPIVVDSTVKRSFARRMRVDLSEPNFDDASPDECHQWRCEQYFKVQRPFEEAVRVMNEDADVLDVLWDQVVIAAQIVYAEQVESRADGRPEPTQEALRLKYFDPIYDRAVHLIKQAAETWDDLLEQLGTLQESAGYLSTPDCPTLYADEIAEELEMRVRQYASLIHDLIGLEVKRAAFGHNDDIKKWRQWEEVCNNPELYKLIGPEVHQWVRDGGRVRASSEFVQKIVIDNFGAMHTVR